MLSAHSAVEPAPRDKQWMERHDLINKRAAEAGGKAEVIFIGDSITQGWEGAGKEVWAKYYSPRNAVNLGIGGDRTQHVLWRLENGNIKGLKPKAAVLMIGTNNSNGEDNTPGQIAEGIAAIVRKLRTELPTTKILLVAIFPRSENYSVQRGKLAMINQVIRRQADDQNVFWVDFGHQFLNNDGTIPQSLMPDFLHLSPKGYQIWADAIEPLLGTILSGKPTASAGAALAGEWVATLPGPNGDPVDVGLSLKLEDGKLVGGFNRGEGRTLAVSDVSISGDEFAWVVVRERQDGGKMTYKMNGRVEDGKIKGKATTELDGAVRTIEWSARKK
jgi:beta-glucosidase